MLPWQEARCLPNPSTPPFRRTGCLPTRQHLTSVLPNKASPVAGRRTFSVSGTCAIPSGDASVPAPAGSAACCGASA